MTAIRKTKGGPAALRKRGITVIAGLLIGLGLTAAAAPAVYFAFQENFSQFTEFAAIDVQRLNAVRDGDRLVVTGTIQNVGSTSISSIILEELSVDDLRIQQDGTLDDGSPSGDYGTYTINGKLYSGASCTSTGQASGTAITTGCVDGTVTIEGLSTAAGTLVRIDGDGSVVLRIEVESPGGTTPANFDLSKNVDLTEEVAITLRYLAGESEEITEVYRTSVKRG